MNSLFLSNIAVNSTQFTGSTLLFKQATFYPCSGFNATGIPIFNTGKLYLGGTSGQLPITIQGVSGAAFASQPAGSGYALISYYTLSGIDDLSKYYVAAQNAGDGCFVLYS